ncbi:hypothetical protein [Pseudoclavibacter sp. VKM Ac-2867]|uniref:hypothetical protein n=1 Tax=Pseudoclavibacter sp. VKM Ac-2867 TaxID=2783829 RepID=UPI001E60C81E|nr:hypothetical protein [Pseudoclavibacter sp. VKM Ac-2867]
MARKTTRSTSVIYPEGIMSNSNTSPDAATQGPKRRTIVAGAAWSIPTMVYAVTAPAAAASADCLPQDAAIIESNWAFTEDFRGWTTDKLPANGPNVWFAASFEGLTTVALVAEDPAPGRLTTTTLTSSVACLAAGTYSFTFDARLYNINTRQVTLTASVTDIDSPAEPLATTAFTTLTDGPTTSQDGNVLTVTVSERTSVQFSYSWHFPTARTGSGDDLAVNAPRVAKIA